MHLTASITSGAIGQARGDRAKRLRRIRRIANSGTSLHRERRLKIERDAYIRSPLVRLAIFSHHPELHCWNLERLRALVQKTRPDARCTETILYRSEPKQSGGHRFVCCRMPAAVILGQDLSKDLVTAQLNPHPNVFDWSGRGLSRYARRLALALEHDGPFVATLDLRSCHASVDPDAIYRLNLIPEEVIRWSLDHRNLNFRPAHLQETCPLLSDLNSTGPRGLLQGGSSSSSILTALIGWSVAKVTRAHCQSYSDNFVIVGPSADEVQQAVGELTRIVAGSRVGRLKFHTHEVVDARSGFEQVGFHFVLSDGRTWVTPNCGNSIKIMSRIEAAMASADDNRISCGHSDFVTKEITRFCGNLVIDVDELANAAELLWQDEVSRRTTQPGET